MNIVQGVMSCIESGSNILAWVKEYATGEVLAQACRSGASASVTPGMAQASLSTRAMPVKRVSPSPCLS